MDDIGSGKLLIYGFSMVMIPKIELTNNCKVIQIFKCMKFF